MANYKEEIANILRKEQGYVVPEQPEITTEEILEVLSSGELPELPLVKAEVVDATPHVSPYCPDREDYNCNPQSTGECMDCHREAQRNSDLAIIQPYIAALKAENEELKKHIADDNMDLGDYARTVKSLKAQLSTARAEVEELKKNVDIYEELLANVLDVMNEADVELPYLAPDKGEK